MSRTPEGCADYARYLRMVKLDETRKRAERFAERDAKAPLVTIKIRTRRNSLGATIVCEQRGTVPGGTWCMRRY